MQLSEKIKESPEQKVVRSVLMNQLALNANEDLRQSYPSLYSKKLKYTHNNYVEELKKSEIIYDQVFEKQEEATVASYEVIDLTAEAMCMVPIWEMPDVIQVIKAYLLDKKSITGLAKKINKQKKEVLCTKDREGPRRK